MLTVGGNIDIITHLQMYQLPLLKLQFGLTFNTNPIKYVFFQREFKAL
ncbi:hypothetical protein [Shewanella violacea]